jgi:hypothetical protein
MGMRLVEACGRDAYQPGFALHLGHGLAAAISEGGTEATGVRGEYLLGSTGYTRRRKMRVIRSNQVFMAIS